MQRAAVGKDGAVTIRDTGLIDYARFLEKFNVTLSRAQETHRERGGGGGGGDASGGGASGGGGVAIEALYQHHEALTAVFRFLDTDGSGVVSREEFRDGVALLNARLPPRQQLPPPDDLFDALDLDGSGGLELDEMCAAFQVHFKG